MKDKLILSDCDGVMLHWEWGFDRWMEKHGYKKINEGNYSLAACYGLAEPFAEQLMNMFNETVYMRCLPPYLDAIRYVRKLHRDHGYIFHVITSVGDDPEVVRSRTKNLYNVFGKSCFYQIDCLDHSVCKTTLLNNYAHSGCWWIEDSQTNYIKGEALGLSCLLVNQHYNVADTRQFNRVSSWKQIYQTIVQQ